MLTYTTSGDARRPTVLFLHGFMGSAADWSETMAALEDRFYCIAANLPGHGGSLGLPYPESYTIESAAKELIDLLDDLNVSKAVVVGYSMGGRLALYFGLRHPERCAALFLESASPGLETEPEREARRETDEKRAKRLETEDFETFLEDWYRQPLFASLARDEELLCRTIEARRKNDPGELAKSLRGMGTGSQPSLWEELAGLRAPALAVAGELDEKYIEIAHRMADAGPGLRYATTSDAGHNPRVEASEAYLALLQDFLHSL
ncbi:MAG: 2-succinyl-6-hydroxy-2,4-cyclohexadiene-1-carboxylate synthase [Rubrobacteraceae bacterium]